MPTFKFQIWSSFQQLETPEKQAVHAHIAWEIEGELKLPNKEVREAIGSQATEAFLGQISALSLSVLELRNILLQIRTNWSDEIGNEEEEGRSTVTLDLDPKIEADIRNVLKLPYISDTKKIEISGVALTGGDPEIEFTTGEIQEVLRHFGVVIRNPAALIQSMGQKEKPELIVTGKTGKRELQVKLSTEAAEQGRRLLLGLP